MNYKIRVLLVEDNPGDARLVREMLLRKEAASFELQTVERLAQAFDKLRESSFDIMLLDLGLPDSQGPETIKKVRTLAANMPIIILTGLADEAIGMQAVEQGAQDFLVKGEVNETVIVRSIHYAIERKQIEEALRHSEQRYHGLFEGMMGIGALIEVSCDSRGLPSGFRFLDVNRAFEEMFEKDREEVIGKEVKDILPLTGNAWFEKCGRVALTGKADKFQDYFADFEKVFDFSAYSPQKGQAAVIGWDITEQVNASRALRESEERLELAVSGASLGLWDWDIGTGQVVFNERAVEILGYSLEEIDTDVKALVRLIHPDDLLNMREKIPVHLSQNSTVLEIEFRFLAKGGEWLWIQINGRVVDRGDDDKAVRAAGIIRDISQTVRAQGALRDSEVRYRQIVETSSEGILMHDAEEKIIFANRQTADMLGCTVEELLGSPIYNFMDEEGRQIAQGHTDRRKMGIREQYDFRFRRKDGSDFWAILSATPLVDDAGRYQGALKMIADINERKISEIREKARFALLNKLRHARTIDECLTFGCKAIFDSRLFGRAAYVFYDGERSAASFGQFGLEKTEINAIKRSQAPAAELLGNISQSKHRISKSYFVPEGSITELEGKFLNIGNSGCKENHLWKPGDILITPVGALAGDESAGLVTVACPFDAQKPPSTDFVQRLEEIVDMVLIRAREIRRAEELAAERLALSEKNVALKEIMSVIEAEKMEIRQQIAGMIDQVLKPAVNRLVRRDGTVNKTYFDLLKYNLDELSTATGAALHISSKLSPREMEICAMIKNGASSKDIAEALDIALVTVQKHREVIRKKLGLTNKNINLTTHLRNM